MYRLKNLITGDGPFHKGFTKKIKNDKEHLKNSPQAIEATLSVKFMRFLDESMETK